ncbi:hypothetical protein [Komagataeibacter sp. FNDCF1]|uniref:hypothetical protein n=1 Tax=Komagataeibacter sp. FNDCF1 TaxID=2878681 RepID=UPI001E382E61|nr:hypothetical protein [Komagataeibacter sp. FNDCF1]MCE2566441.1 hypothetical protein [Komagataeibacter sp. FNDCF1]
MPIAISREESGLPIISQNPFTKGTKENLLYRLEVQVPQQIARTKWQIDNANSGEQARACKEFVAILWESVSTEKFVEICKLLKGDKGELSRVMSVIKQMTTGAFDVQHYLNQYNLSDELKGYLREIDHVQVGGEATAAQPQEVQTKN